MRSQSGHTKERVSKRQGRSTEIVGDPKGKASPSRHDLSTTEILKLWDGLNVLEVRVLGLFRASGEPAAVAAVTTILGFVMLFIKHASLGVCFAEGVLGLGLTWILKRKGNAKSKSSS